MSHCQKCPDNFLWATTNLASPTVPCPGCGHESILAIERESRQADMERESRLLDQLARLRARDAVAQEMAECMKRNAEGLNDWRLYTSADLIRRFEETGR